MSAGVHAGGSLKGVTMAALLEIDDGATAWWESPDIWVVPGPDPLGAPGTPVAGSPAYVWARVHNRGTTDVQSAAVVFWWSDPSAGVTRTLSTQIGTAFVDVVAGATEDVLCLSPWVPSFVNGGHECLVCEVVSPADPLPVPAPDLFDPPTFHQIAQRNLSVLEVAPMVMTLQLALGLRSHQREVVMYVEVGGELDRATAKTLGLEKAKPAKEPLVVAGLSASPACDAKSAQRIGVSVGDGGSAGAFVHLRPSDTPSGDAPTYSLVRVRHDAGPNGGGITYVVRSAAPTKASKKASEKGAHRG